VTLRTTPDAGDPGRTMLVQHEPVIIHMNQMKEISLFRSGVHAESPPSITFLKNLVIVPTHIVVDKQKSREVCDSSREQSCGFGEGYGSLKLLSQKYLHSWRKRSRARLPSSIPPGGYTFPKRVYPPHCRVVKKQCCKNRRENNAECEKLEELFRFSSLRLKVQGEVSIKRTG